MSDDLIVPHPAEVIDLRRQLVGFWDHDTELSRFVAMQGREASPWSSQWGEEANLARIWFAEQTRSAELYWVSAEMSDLIVATAGSLPDVHASLPCPSGLVVFAKPLPGIDSQDGATIHTAAFMWAPVMIGPIACIGIETFGWRDAMTPRNVDAEVVAAQIAEFRQTMPLRLVPTGGSEWPNHSTLEEFSLNNRMGSLSDTARASILEDRRYIGTFWALTEQRLTDKGEEHGDRAVRRRAQRAGLPLKPVRVVTLRQMTREHQPLGTHVDWSHRWIVNGHWRQQPYGPGRQLRRAVYVAPFVKGPADKPLVIRDTVRALKR